MDTQKVIEEVIKRKVIKEYEENGWPTKEARLREETAIRIIQENLKTIIDSNAVYLKYAQAKGWFKMTPDEEKERATHNALITIIGRAIDFDVDQARRLAFEVLQEVNDHENAKKVADLLGLELKAYEVE